jgi:hypothetical protein
MKALKLLVIAPLVLLSANTYAQSGGDRRGSGRNDVNYSSRSGDSRGYSSYDSGRYGRNNGYVSVSYRSGYGGRSYVAPRYRAPRYSYSYYAPLPRVRPYYYTSAYDYVYDPYGYSYGAYYPAYRAPRVNIVASFGFGGRSRYVGPRGRRR